MHEEERLSPRDIARIYGCSATHAAALMKYMGRFNIATGKVPRWRVTKTNFDLFEQARRDTTAKMVSGSALGPSIGGRLLPANDFRPAARTGPLRASSVHNSSGKSLIREPQPRNAKRSAT